MAGTQDWNKKREEALAKSRQLKEVLLRQEPTFLGVSGRINGKPTYCCPFCPSGRGKNRTGISLIPRTQTSIPKYHCFACNATASVIDLAQAYYGSIGFKETIEILKQYYHISDLTVDLTEIIKRQEELEEENEVVAVVENQTEYIRDCRRALDPSYLEKRGISAETQKHFWIGTDNAWIHPNISNKEGAEKYATKRCIIPTSQYSYLARDVHPKSEIPEIQRKHEKMKYGPQHLFNEKNVFKLPAGSPIYVVEGEIDAMSIYDITKGYVQALGLGSTGQWNKFVQAARMMGQDKYYVLMLDNDLAGETTTKKIIEHLSAYNIPYMVQKFPKEYNDPNEMLQNDRAGLRQLVIETLKEIKAEKGKHKSLGGEAHEIQEN